MVTLKENLEFLAPKMWRYIESGEKCAAIGDKLKRLFGRLAKELNESHEKHTFYGNLSDQNIMFDQYGASGSITFPQCIFLADSAVETAKGMYNDLDAFMNIFISFVNEHEPQCSKTGSEIKFPPEIRYMLRIWNERAKIIPSEDNLSSDQVRKLEFWIFNAPLFFERESMEPYIYKIYNFWDRHGEYFLSHVSLTTGDGEFSEWQRRLESSQVVNYYDQDNRDDIYKAYDEILKVLKHVYDVGIKEHKAKYYHQPIGVVEFVQNCFEHVGKQNYARIEHILQAVFPELLGKIHYELFLWEPKVDSGFNLYKELSGGVTEYYQYGWQAERQRQEEGRQEE